MLLNVHRNHKAYSGRGAGVWRGGPGGGGGGGGEKPGGGWKRETDAYSFTDSLTA